MKKLLSLLLIICSIGVAYADDKSTVTSLKYVTDELNTRQDKFGANDGKAMTFTNAAGGNLPRDVKASLGTSTSDNGLPTVSAVNTGIATKQDEIGAANTNTVVTYTGTPGTLGQKGIYQDTGTYAAQSDNLIQASTFNAALRNGLENEFVCADRDPVSNQCWLWTIHNEENVGKNLFDISQPSTGQKISNGIWRKYNVPITLQDGDWTCKYMPNISAGTYTLSANSLWYRIVFFDGENATIIAPSATRATFTLPSAGEVWIFCASYSSMANITEAQLERGNTATPYEPYVGETVNVYIPQNQTAQNN